LKNDNYLLSSGKYRQRGEKYLKNAKEKIAREDWGKGAEFLWGAVSSLLNAICVLYEYRPITNHQEMVNFGKKLATELKDKEMYNFFDETGNKLHANFYHEFMSSQEVSRYYLDTIKIAKKLNEAWEQEKEIKRR
jgi:hypothetical protein